MTGEIGLTQLRDFPTLGWLYQADSDGLGSPLPGVTTLDRTPVIEFSYLAAERAHELLVPGFQRGRLMPVGSSERFTFAGFRAPDQNLVRVTLYKPGAQNRELALDFTSFGVFDHFTTLPGGGTGTITYGRFAYGVPTPSLEVPTSGTATYRAVGYGTALAEARPIASAGNPGSLEGTATLAIDFAAGAGTVDARSGLNDGTGAFVEIAPQQFSFSFQPGSGTFSASFAVPGSAEQGFLEGRFTGPSASEIMVRWIAPYRNPESGDWGTIFGVWVGRRG